MGGAVSETALEKVLPLLADAPKTLLIVRGISGAGKSHLIAALKSALPKLHSVALDDFREHGGVYRYDSSRDERERVRRAALLKMRVLMAGGGPVALEGAFLNWNAMADFIAAARGAGYERVILTLKCDPDKAARRTVHGVAPSQIERMAAALEAEKILPMGCRLVEVTT